MRLQTLIINAVDVWRAIAEGVAFDLRREWLALASAWRAGRAAHRCVWVGHRDRELATATFQPMGRITISRCERCTSARVDHNPHALGIFGL